MGWQKITKILVTGGAGYIGSNCAHKLVKAGYDVLVYDNLVYGHKKALPETATFIEGDLSDIKKLEVVFKEHKIDAVMHFAAYTYVGESVENPRKYFQNNYMNGFNLLNVMLDHGVKNIIFSSTCAIFGQPEKVPITEDLPKAPINPYGLAKLMFENTLSWYDQAYGLKSICLRYFNAAGADFNIGEDHDPETHLIPLVLQVALGKRQNIKIFGTDYPTKDGTCVRDYIHISDLSEAHILALRKLLDKGVSESYNLGSGEGNSVKELIEVAREVTGHTIPAVESGRRAGDPAVLIGDSTRIKKELGWNPKNDLKSIIKSAWEWHNTHPDGFEDD
ncbi:UDP-glucose 4-epimerase GalE [Nanoarchaeota archaeon]